jgi:hypothetical protein
MHIAGPELRAQTSSFTGEAKKRMKAILPEMAVVSDILLDAIGRVFGGIEVDDQAALV